MPQVASPSTKVHAHNHAQHARAAQSAPGEGRGTPSLFDSLVDQSASATRPPRGDAPDAPAECKPAAPKAAKDGNDRPQAKADAPAVAAAPGPADASVPADEAVDVAQALADAVAQAARPEASKEPAKDTAADAAAKADGDQPAAPATVNPSLIGDAAAAAATVAAAQPAAPAPEPAAATAQDTDATPVTAAAVATTTVPGPQAEPAEPAFVAASTAQKLEPFEGKDKRQAAKPAAADSKAALPPQPAPAEDQPAPAPQPQAEAKADAGDKAVAKPDAQPRHERADAVASMKFDVVAPAGTDGSAAAGTQAASAASGAAAAHAANGSSASAAPQSAAGAQQMPAIPIAGLAVEIAGRAHAGKNNFEIRLDPPELGRIEVKLSVDHQGRVTSHLIADRPDTFDLLRRDASGLERALQDAGLKTGGDGLQFSLRDQAFTGQQNGEGRSNASQFVAADDSLPVIDPIANGYTRNAGRIGGIDIRV